MKKIILAVTLCAAAAFLQVKEAKAEVVDQIVAIVNDDIITFSELKKILNPIYAQYEKSFEGDDLVEKMVRARSEVLSQLINNKLLTQEAKKKGLKVEEKEVEDRLKQIKDRFPSEDDFNKAIAMDGITIDALKKNIEEQLLVREFAQRELASKAMVAPREVEEYYSAHGNEFMEGEMINVCNILVKRRQSGDGTDRALEIINNILKEAKSGGNFEVLAKRYSEGPNADKGGDMGFFPRGSMMKEIEDAAFNMKVGEVSEVIKTDRGYHILYLKARRSRRQIPIQDVAKDIEKELFQRKIEEAKAEYVKELKQKAYIKIME